MCSYATKHRVLSCRAWMYIKRMFRIQRSGKIRVVMHKKAQRSRRAWHTTKILKRRKLLIEIIHIGYDLKPIEALPST